MKIFSQISKGAIASAGMVFIGMASDSTLDMEYRIAFGVMGIALLTIFVALVERQATAAALKKFKASKAKRKKK